VNLRIVGAVYKKDVLSLLPLVVLSSLLFFGDALITRLDLLPIWSLYGAPVLLVALLVLTLSVFQLDSPASLTDDWLCRPVQIPELLTAKFALVMSTVYLSRAVGTLAADLGLGFSLAEALQDAFLLPDKVFPLMFLLFLYVAVVTRTFAQAFGVLFAIFICVFVLPTPFVRPPGPLTPGIREALWFSGMGWLATAPTQVAGLMLAMAGLWLVYWRRRLAQARALLALSVCLTLLIIITPMWLWSWNSTFAVQKFLGPATGANAGNLSLRNPQRCFPATLSSGLATDASFEAARHSANLALWDDESLQESLQEVGPGAVAFLTTIEPRGLPPDWRAKLNYVQAEFSSDGRARYSLRPARYLTDERGGGSLTHAWMLPEPALQELRQAQPALQLTYSLTLLAPHEYAVRVNGKRQTLPGLGFCSATRIEPANRIDVDCFSGVSRPAQISAELAGISATRVYGSVDFAPVWARWPYGNRVKLVIGSSRLSSSDHITVTAWTVARYLDESLTLPGILGADLATCPLPGDAGNKFQNSRWSDSTPHQSLSISVDSGVQLEVLDFGGSGSPIVLLPGLGATAHSYDDLAPQLAKSHRVIAITRRGTGYSSRPDFGFDTPRLSQDVLAVMNQLGLERVLLVGHSIAGEELSWLGGQHAQRFTGLVYLDAAYDRAAERGSVRAARLRQLNSEKPPEPPLPPNAFLDYETTSRFLEQRGHHRYPEGELIAFLNADKPFAAGTPNIDTRAQQAILAAVQAPDYARIKIPAVALYAFPDPHRALPPWYDSRDRKLMANLAEIHGIVETTRRENLERFRHGVEEAEVVEVPRASHYILQSNPREVLEAIERFSARIQGRQ
jgi:non-heme chloroperoxidase